MAACFEQAKRSYCLAVVLVGVALLLFGVREAHGAETRKPTEGAPAQVAPPEGGKVPETISADEFKSRLIQGVPIVKVEVAGDVFMPGFQSVAPVDVRFVTFRGTVDLPFATFAGPVTFEGCHFDEGATFTSSFFRGPARFAGSVFARRAWFWRARFLDTVSFRYVTVSPKGRIVDSVDDGEFNISWAHFAKEADFYLARLHGWFRLYRTVFLGDVNMEETLFEKGADFNGRKGFVSIDLVELARATQVPAETLFDRLIGSKIATDDAEIRLDERRTRYVHPVAASETELGIVLERTGEETRVRAALLAAYREEAKPMFAPGAIASLQRIEIGASGRLQFSDVDLREVRLLGTRLSNASLQNVAWHSRPIALGAVERLTTADEAVSPTELSRLQQLDLDIAGVYERQKEDGPASGFRVSAREMARRGQSGTSKFISSTYRMFAAYGESPGVALFWLGFLVLGLFPLAFYLAGRPAGLGLGKSIVHSLEVATFLSSARDTGPDPTQSRLLLRILTGIERVAVSAQLGFFVLALRRLFPL
jgi:uncharacterized protein YjbI with pentapeptide repeats